MTSRRVIARPPNTPDVADWRFEEDDYGDPMIFHRHAADEAPAYVIGRGRNWQLARCSKCRARLELDSTKTAMRNA
jgi:hypothetical protein